MSAGRSAESDHVGLDRRYYVEKIVDPSGKHDDCRYFVLDPQHDPIAVFALRAYADEAYNRGRHAFANELDRWASDAEAAMRCCDGCGSSLVRCIEAKEDGKVVCCPECAHPAQGGGAS